MQNATIARCSKCALLAAPSDYKRVKLTIYTYIIDNDESKLHIYFTRQRFFVKPFHKPSQLLHIPTNYIKSITQRHLVINIYTHPNINMYGIVKRRPHIIQGVFQAN